MWFIMRYVDLKYVSVSFKSFKEGHCVLPHLNILVIGYRTRIIYVLHVV